MEGLKFSLEKIAEIAKEDGLSDIHIVPETPIRKRVFGELRIVDPFLTLSVEETQSFLEYLKEYLSVSRRLVLDKEIKEYLNATVVLSLQGMRFRCQVSKSAESGWKFVFRKLSDKIPKLDTLGYSKEVLDGFYAHFINPYKNNQKIGGLGIFVGATGSGKSTSMAALLREVADCKIAVITLEDPAEYLFNEKSLGFKPIALFDQKEQGVHFQSFSSALRSAMREDPDVVMVGEIRDESSLILALQIALSGHFVITTFHASSVEETLQRLIEMGKNRTSDIQTVLASVLKFIIYQNLAPATDGRRTLVYQALFFDNNQKQKVARGDIGLISADIDQTKFSESLASVLIRRVKENKILPQTAFSFISDEDFKRELEEKLGRSLDAEYNCSTGRLMPQSSQSLQEGLEQGLGQDGGESDNGFVL